MSIGGWFNQQKGNVEEAIKAQSPARVANASGKPIEIIVDHKLAMLPVDCITVGADIDGIPLGQFSRERDLGVYDGDAMRRSPLPISSLHCVKISNFTITMVARTSNGGLDIFNKDLGVRGFVDTRWSREEIQDVATKHAFPLPRTSVRYRRFTPEEQRFALHYSHARRQDDPPLPPRMECVEGAIAP